MKRREFIKKSIAGTAGLGIVMSSYGNILTEAEYFLANQNTFRSVAQVIPAWEVMVQPTLHVKRTLPLNKMIVDPFILLDHFGPKHIMPGEGVGVAAHPHRGFEPVSFMFEGHLEHKDSLGNTGLLDSGGIQWMTSGSGIVHSEDMAKRYTGNGGTLHGIQLWVNLPKEHKMTKPGYQNISKESIPVLIVGKGKAQIKVVAGTVFDKTGPAKTFTPIQAFMISMQPGTKLEIPVPVAYNSFSQLLTGSLIVNGKNYTGSNLVLYNNDGRNILLESPESSEPTEILFLAGQPLNEPVVQYGPFVMNSQAEIQEAFDDYYAGKMGRIDH